jgi:hypothetical protein
MRRSSKVTLVLIGLGALAGCGEEKRQDVYASREDCLADWGKKPEDCKPSTDPRHSGRGYYMGPLVAVPGLLGRGFSSWSGSSATSSRSIGSSSSGSRSVSRGGFGSSSRSSGG